MEYGEIIAQEQRVIKWKLGKSTRQLKENRGLYL
jgi:hypothetical protein